MRTSTSATWLFLLAAATAPAQSVTVRLFDYSGLTADEIEQILRVTAVPFAHGGIGVSWIHCRGALAGEATLACAGELQFNEIVVRLQSGRPPSLDLRNERFGYAVVGPQGGQYATVYVSEVRVFAAEWAIAFDLVLGYAMAHEIGHCLLGPGHSVAGLMRANWTRQDIRRIARLSSGLSRQEALRAASRVQFR